MLTKMKLLILILVCVPFGMLLHLAMFSVLEPKPKHVRLANEKYIELVQWINNQPPGTGYSEAIKANEWLVVVPNL